MKATVEIDLSGIIMDDESLSSVLRNEISNEIRIAVKKIIRNDKRFSELVKEAANSFFETVKVVRK